MILRAMLLLGLCASGVLSTPRSCTGQGSAPAALDTLIEVMDHRLHFVVHRGTRPITVVLEAGGGSDLTGSWGDLPGAIAARTGATVVAYDRAGLGRSSLPPAGAPDPSESIRNLRAALDVLGVPGRRVLVGTSYGAMFSLLTASLYPDEILGLVLVDPMNPRFIAATGDFVISTAPVITTPANDRERVILKMGETLTAFAREVQATESRLTLPIVVITAGVPWWGRPEIDAAWRRSHEELAAASPGRALIVAEGARHLIGIERPDVVLDAIGRLVEEVD